MPAYSEKIEKTETPDILGDQQSPVFCSTCLYDSNIRYESDEHVYYEILYVKKGFALYKNSKSFTVLIPGDVILIPPCEEHEFINTNSIELYKFAFKNDVAEKFFTGAGSVNDSENRWYIFAMRFIGGCVKVHVDPFEITRIGGIFQEASEECRKKEPGWISMVSAYLFELIIALGRIRDRQKSVLRSASKYAGGSIYKALEHINNKYMTKKEIDITGLAKISSLSYDYFIKRFKQLTGMCPVNYINNLKIAKAMDLLAIKEMTISDVCFEAGFEDANYFARIFRKYVGCAPSKFKEACVRRDFSGRIGTKNPGKDS